MGDREVATEAKALRWLTPGQKLRAENFARGWTEEGEALDLRRWFVVMHYLRRSRRKSDQDFAEKMTERFGRLAEAFRIDADESGPTGRDVGAKVIFWPNRVRQRGNYREEVRRTGRV